MWWQAAKIYELYIDKFAGDIRTLTERLDYFTQLGVNCLHILPHYPSPMVDEGYDVSDYRGVRAELGTLNDFEAFLAAAKAKGIRIVTDLVLNHTSVEHPWFIEARSSKESPKRRYYLWSETGREFPDAINPMPFAKPRNWIPSGAGDYFFATFYPQQADLNWDEPAVFDEMLSIMEFWIERGVDGFRLDAVPFLIKREGTDCTNLPETHARVRKLRAALAAHPDVALLAEAGTHSWTYFGNGDECQLVYNFYLTECFWIALMRGDVSGVERAMAQTRNIPPHCQWVTFLGNHDAITIYSLSSEERHAVIRQLDPSGAYTSDDSPAVRVAEALSGYTEKMLAAFEMLYRAPGAPVMYYGDELGMRNLPAREGVADKRVYVRAPFDWEEARRQMGDPSSFFSRVAAIIRGSRRV